MIGGAIHRYRLIAAEFLPEVAVLVFVFALLDQFLRVVESRWRGSWEQFSSPSTSLRRVLSSRSKGDGASTERTTIDQNPKGVTMIGMEQFLPLLILALAGTMLAAGALLFAHWAGRRGRPDK